MTDEHVMPQYDGMEYEELVAAAQFLWMENVKLREKYYEYESKMNGLVCKLTGGLLSKSATLPNDALYSVVEEQMTDELVDENFKLRLENQKLRRLARGLNWCTENAKVPSAECERCPLGDTFFECGELSCEKLMRELGIEVGK